MNRLPSHFFGRDPADVARDLLGKRFISTFSGERIVGLFAETERIERTILDAMGFGEDEGNSKIFGPVGRLYVYQSYGIHFCVNIVLAEFRCWGRRFGARIHSFRRKGLGHHADARLISGPGNTTKALHITKAQNHSELLTEDAQFQIVEGVSLNETDIVATPRIGISQGVDNSGVSLSILKQLRLFSRTLPFKAISMVGYLKQRANTGENR